MQRLWTIGHSTRAWEAFVALLCDARIDAVADIRRYPGSRRHPQFSGEAMARQLPVAGICYVPMPELGGRRSPRAGSRNTAWRNAGFRGYADYMETPAYAAARDALAALASGRRTAILCAEVLWWQCHRGLVADDFKASGWEVLHLSAPGRIEPHPYTRAARIVDGELRYTVEGDPQAMLF
jgi:uncharacterized protein (DUF488 family)